MTARDATYRLMQQLGARGISLSFDEVNTLRRAQITLHRWAELECGDGNDYASWAIERDETTGHALMVTYPHQGNVRRRRIADKETGALRRIKAICSKWGIYFYHQTDPRGCALYVSNEPLPDHNYTRGVAIC